MRGPHVRFCERREGAILRAYSTDILAAAASAGVASSGGNGGWIRGRPSLSRGPTSWPTRHRSSDEAIHELASQPFVGDRGREIRIQHGNRLPVRNGSPA